MEAADLGELLDVAAAGDDRFVGLLGPISPVTQLPRLFGGQVAAQALVAAGRTVDGDRAPQSMHGYFLRQGSREAPVELEVERLLDGRRLASRQVSAHQDGRLLFRMLASFGASLDAASYEPDPVDAPSPDEARRANWETFLDAREITPTRVGSGGLRISDRLWLRSHARLPDDPLLHAAALVFMSDMGSGWGQVEREGLSPGGVTIDHAVWFHGPLVADDWCLLALDPVRASHGHALYTGTIRQHSGALGLVLTQEMLLMEPVDQDDPGVRRRLERFMERLSPPSGG